MNLGTSDKAELQTSWVDQTVAELDHALNTSCQLWERNREGDWGLGAKQDESLHTIDDIGNDLERAHAQQEPISVVLESSGHLLVVPLTSAAQKATYCAVTSITTDRPDLLVHLCKSILHANDQKEKIAQLREESGMYLQQLSEDLEELTFLRAMAEKLALGGLSLRLEGLVEFVLPQLGEAAGVEAVYYIDCQSEGQLHVSDYWQTDSCQTGPTPSEAIQLVELFQEKALDRPVVKNHFLEDQANDQFPEIREFILIPVATSEFLLGWLLAVNRRCTQEKRHPESIWDLSQCELGSCEASLISTTAAMLASHAHNLALFGEKEGLLISVVQTLVAAVDSRDPYTCGHSERVARYGRRLAQEIGFDDEASLRLYLTGLLHDIGKIGVSDAVLKKAGPLTGEEFEEIKRHPELGWAILQELEQMSYVLPGVLHHHERIDGKGYPDRLAGEQTPLEGRLLAVVDAFDAMTSDRPYRKGMPVEKAVNIMQEGAGTQWDSGLVETFVRLLPEMLEIRDNYQRPPMPDRKELESASNLQADNQGSGSMTSPVLPLLSDTEPLPLAH